MKLNIPIISTQLHMAVDPTYCFKMQSLQQQDPYIGALQTRPGRGGSVGLIRGY